MIATQIRASSVAKSNACDSTADPPRVDPRCRADRPAGRRPEGKLALRGSRGRHRVRPSRHTNASPGSRLTTKLTTQSPQAAEPRATHWSQSIVTTGRSVRVAPLAPSGDDPPTQV